MKRGSKKLKIFSSVNVILIALLFVELIFVVDSGITGHPIKSVIKKAVAVESSVGKINIAKTASCIPSKEICDKKDNDCDKLVDEGGVCKATSTTTTATQSPLGTLTTKEGTVELIIQDNFEKPELSKELYYLNENGKRYLLSIEQPLPVSAKIKVTGYLKENTLSFSNSQTKSASLQGTSYTMASSTIEPWPKTLGEQKYAVVFLFRGNETQFDVNNFTNITFSLANEWIKNSSYRKASVSYWYVGNFTFNESLCRYEEILDDAFKKSDPFVNFNDYDGIIVYHPYVNYTCTGYGGLATIGKQNVSTDDGNISLYNLWINKDYTSDPSYFGILVHEMGHNFGLHHAITLYCGAFPNRKTLGNLCNFKEYGDLFDVMGVSSQKESYGLRNKVVTLGWINSENVPEKSEGTFFIYPFENDSAGTSKIHGIKIPILWDSSHDLVINYPSGYQFPITTEDGPLTHYYLEHRNNLGLNNWNGPPYTNETTYGLNISKINNRGVLLRIGRDDMYWYSNGQPEGYYWSPTWLLTMHPNAEVCGEELSPEGCWNFNSVSTIFTMLLKNETYSDNLNKMNITILDMNESGALVKITRWPTCTDSDGGSNIYTKGTIIATNSSGTYSYTDFCVSSTYVKEYYCENNQALSANLYCSKGCSSLNKACIRPTSTGCYIDPKTKKKVCPRNPVA